MWKKGRESIGKQRKSETAIQAQQKPHPTPWGAPELAKAVLRLAKMATPLYPHLNNPLDVGSSPS